MRISVGVPWGWVSNDCSVTKYLIGFPVTLKCLTSNDLEIPYLTFGAAMQLLLHLPSAETVSVRPNAQHRCN